VAVPTIFDGQPASQLAWAVLEQLPIGVDAIRSGRKSPAAQLRVIVLSDRDDHRAGRMGPGDGIDAVVGAGGQVDDDPIDVGQRTVETGGRPDRDRDRIARPDQIGQAGRPDQVVGEDRDAGCQSSASARWWKTSRAVTTPVGRPSSTIGI
jgi:hypothetical protein